MYYPTGTTTTYGATQNFFDANGNQIKVTDSQDATKNRDLIVTTQGQILQQRQDGKKQSYYYAQGQSVGSVGELSAASFDYNYTPVGDSYPSQTPGSYTVNRGDTLRSIALSVFGDASLWYLVADANGLRSDMDLKPGQTLTIPNQITNLHNDYQTFKPYIAGSVIGDTSPTTPMPDPPPQAASGGGGGRCGALGQILMVVVAVVVTYITAGAALSAMPSLGAVGSAMVGAAAGSTASQLVGMATGDVEKFSWKSVAIAAIGAGLTAGIDINLKIDGLTGKAVNAALNNALNQAVLVAVGLQDKFDWRAVATSAITAPLAQSVAGKVGAGVKNPFGANFASRMVNGVMSQGVRMMVYGGGKMDFSAIAADAFGNAVGDDIVGKMKFASVAAAEKKQQDEAVAEQIKKPVTAEEVANSQSGASTNVPGEKKADKPEDYVVQKGDNLTSIAKKLAGKGATAEEINNKKNQLAAANPDLSDLNLIHPGDKLKKPDENTKVDGATMAKAVAADNAYAADKAERGAIQAQKDQPVWSFREASIAARQADDAMQLNSSLNSKDKQYATAWDGNRGEGRVDWKEVGNLASTAGDMKTLAEEGMGYFAKNDGQKILSSAWPLQRQNMLKVAITDVSEASEIFKNPNGKTAVALAESAGKYSTALKGVAFFGYAATAVEEGAYLANTYQNNNDKFGYAVAASVTNVAGDSSSVYLGAQGGAYLGAFAAPFTAGISIPAGALVGGVIGHFAYDKLVKENVVRAGFTGETINEK